MFAVKRAISSLSSRHNHSFVAAAAVPCATLFHTSSRACVRVGDPIPDVDLMEGSPGSKVNLSKELAEGKGLIIGVPAAFSPSCSESHIPAYLKSPKLSSAGRVFVVSVNDAFVMKAWAAQLDPGARSGVRFLADPALDFTAPLDLAFDDAAAIFGGRRGKRYALCVRDGKVVRAHVEPDNTGVQASVAAAVLEAKEGDW